MTLPRVEVEDIADVLADPTFREIQIRSALACSALSDDVAAQDRDYLLAALEEMTRELREAREAAEKADSDRNKELEDENEALEEEVVSLRQQRDSHASEVTRLRDEATILRLNAPGEGSALKLWMVRGRGALGKGERKIAVFRYLVMARTVGEAVDVARSDNQHADRTWSCDGVPVDDPPVFSIGCYHDDPTEAELRYAGRKPRKAAP